MKLENQVTSLELSKKLKELGVKQESYFKYCGGHTMYDEDDEGKFEECENTDLLGDYEYCHTAGLVGEFTVSAFTVAELGEMLPFEYEEWRTGRNHKNKWFVLNYQIDFEADTEANARAKMLIYLLENKLIK